MYILIGYDYPNSKFDADLKNCSKVTQLKSDTRSTQRGEL